MRKVLLLALSAHVLTAATWYRENLSFGMRDAILQVMALSPSDPSTIYLGSTEGYAFATGNRGLSWNEARLIVDAWPYFGAIRAQPGVSGVAISASDTLGRVLDTGVGSSQLSDSMTFDYDTTDMDYLDASPYPTAYDAAVLPGLGGVGDFTVRDQARGGEAGDDSALGVALGDTAPRLKQMLRGEGADSVGMNLQQLLVEMGVEPTYVNYVDVHPSNPAVALAATSMGLFSTEDHGISWVPLFGGTNRDERDAQHVRFDPGNPDRIYLATMGGFFLSVNRGERFSAVSGSLLEEEFVTWIEPLARKGKPTLLVAGTADGAYLSTDGGASFTEVFYQSLPEASWISSAAIDPNDPGHILLTTYDGLFGTGDGGRSWQRLGELEFSGRLVPRAVVDPSDGQHVLACTERNVLESRDGGRTWSHIYMDDGDWYVRTIALSPCDPAAVWVLTSAEVLRLTRSRPEDRGQREGLLDEVLRKEPTEAQVFARIFATLGVGPERGSQFQMSGSTVALLPQVHLVGGYLDVAWDSGVSTEPLKQLYNVDEIFGVRGRMATPYAAAMLWWDLSGLMYDETLVAAGRVFETSLETMSRLKYEAARYFEERVRLIRLLIVDPPEDFMARLDASLRFRELTEHLNALTGGLYDRQLETIREGGYPWLAQVD